MEIHPSNFIVIPLRILNFEVVVASGTVKCVISERLIVQFVLHEMDVYLGVTHKKGRFAVTE
jgi:hypothetical protein